MANFHNRVRLPITFGKPQFPETRNIYRKSDGTSVVQSIVTRKTYQAVTDYLSERLHERIKILFSHDFIQLEADNYYGRLVQSADYQINWLDFRQFPIAQSKFEAEVSPFDATNSNCQTCADVTQVVCEDDSFYGDLNENTDYTLDVKANDNICCFPVTWSITTFNTAYLSSATIDSAGVIHIHTKIGLVDANFLNLLTYRATCPNGNFDEADVFGNINGSVSGCLAPSSITQTTLTSTSTSFTWPNPSPIPDHYFWKLLNHDAGDILVTSNDATTAAHGVTITGLTPNRNYIFLVRSQCDATDNDGTASNYIQVSFRTLAASSLCGHYFIAYNDPHFPDGHTKAISYLDCNGITQIIYLINNNVTPASICAMQTAPGVPTSITGTGAFVVVSYTAPC